jgi:hypothetical protein|tara:strand:- start:121 stop:441 length:321 start_codon:yes stop_codon:yes gene_type:complete
MDIENYFQFIKQFRPELTIKTLRNYAKELDYFADAYQIGFEPIQLCSMLVDIALETLNLDHITLIGMDYEKSIRLAVFRNLIDIFRNNITNKNYEILDALILEKRI